VVLRALARQVQAGDVREIEISLPAKVHSVGFGTRITKSAFFVYGLILAVLAAGGWSAFYITHYVSTYLRLRAARQSLVKHDIASAEDLLAQCAHDWPDSPEVLHMAAQTARRAGHYDKASRYLKEYRRAGGLPDIVELETALRRAQQGDLATVEPSLVAAAQKDHPDAVLVLEALAHGYLKSYRLSDALDCLTVWLEREPDNVQALLWRADLYERWLNYERALADYRAALGLAPDHTDTRLRFAQVLVQARQPAEALEQFNILREVQPQDPAVLLGLARSRHMRGETEEATRLLDELLSAHPDDPAALTECGKLALEAGQAARGEQVLRRATELDPSDRESLHGLVQCLHQQNKTAEAQDARTKLDRLEAQLDRVAELTRAIGASPNNPALRHEMALIFFDRGAGKEGMRWLHSALEQDPLYSPALRTLAKYSRRSETTAQASQTEPAPVR
jgi:predicted Zn-dependent protease